MRVEVQTCAPAELEADVLAVPLLDGEGVTGAAGELDGPLDGLIARLAQEGELRGELGSARLVHVEGRLPSRRVAVAGIGKAERLDADALRTAASAVASEVGEFAESVGWAIDESLSLTSEEQARAIVEGTLLGGYQPGRWKHNGQNAKLA